MPHLALVPFTGFRVREAEARAGPDHAWASARNRRTFSTRWTYWFHVRSPVGAGRLKPAERPPPRFALWFWVARFRRRG
jgi:hypothetical protein